MPSPKVIVRGRTAARCVLLHAERSRSNDRKRRHSLVCAFRAISRTRLDRDSPRRDTGIDIGKNTFHVIGYDKSGAIVLRQKWSRGQVELDRADGAREAKEGLHHPAERVRDRPAEAHGGDQDGELRLPRLEAGQQDF